MNYILLSILLLATSVTAKQNNLRSYNATDFEPIQVIPTNVLVVEIEEKKYTMTGTVSYPNWAFCESESRMYAMKLICFVSEDSIDVTDFAKLYSKGIPINCAGNVIDGVWVYETEKPNYYGCAITNGEITYFFLDSLVSFPAWAIAVIAVAAFLCLCISSCIGYNRYKQ